MSPSSSFEFDSRAQPSRPEREAKSTSSRPITNEKKSKHTLLLVDDEADVLASLRGMFRRHYHVLTAERASAALDILKSQTVHLVISDQRMPDMSGTDFLARVAQDYPDVVRLMMTGYADLESVIDAINRGHVFRYISKPWDPGDLETAVRQALEHYDLIAERTRLVRELEEANQLKAAFITVAGHELNTPLTIVSGMIQLAMSRSKEPAIRDFLDRALRAAKRLQALLSNTFKLLQQKDFHRSLERETINADEFLRQISDELDPYLCERGHHLSIELSSADLEFRASRIHLRDALENLLTNAIKFSPDNSTIELRARRDGEQIDFEVADHGVGIAWEDQPHVFEPLFSTWDTLHHSTGDFGYCKRGMGLGLAIVKKFVEMHGGEIDFDSVPGKGTTFRIRLPAE